MQGLPDEFAVRQWVVDRMALLAIHGETGIEVRSLFGFQNIGALKRLGSYTIPDGQIAHIVADPDHRLREPSPPGPCILIRPDGAIKEHRVFRVASFFMDTVPERRRIALSYLDQLSEAAVLTQRSQYAVRDHRSALLSRGAKQWKNAASHLHDTTEEDWLLNLAGLRQSIVWEFDQGIRDYMQRVLRPSVAAVDSIDLVWWHPHTQGDLIEEAIVSIARETPSLPNALDRYFHALGHLPFAPAISMGRLVKEWRQAQQDASEACWDTLWNWADKKETPVARYHVCQAAAMEPSLVPAEGITTFWEEVCSILGTGTRTETDNETSVAWRLRFHLALHYIQYFECLLPWNDGERPHALAWWMAEQVAPLFTTTDENLDQIHENFFSPTSLHWHLARTRVGASELRTQSLFPPSIWQRSMLAQVVRADGLDLGAPANTPGHRLVVDTSLIVHDYHEFRFGTAQDGASDTTDKFGYAFETPLEQSIDAWLGSLPSDKQGEHFKAVVSQLHDLKRTPLSERLPGPDGIPEEVVLIGLRNGTYAQTLERAPLEAMMRDDATALRVLSSLDESALWPLIDALMESAAAADTEWRVVVPHVLASACLACEDERRRELLFALTIDCSIATDTVSAIRMIFQHPQGHRFRDAAATRHSFLRAQFDTVPQWLAARIRSVLAALDV